MISQGILEYQVYQHHKESQEVNLSMMYWICIDGIVHPKIEMLSSITHPHVISNP